MHGILVDEVLLFTLDGHLGGFWFMAITNTDEFMCMHLWEMVSLVYISERGRNHWAKSGVRFNL